MSHPHLKDWSYALLLDGFEPIQSGRRAAMNSIYAMPIVEDDNSKSRLETSRIQFHNILVATDFSIYARSALDVAITMAKRTGGRLFLLHASIPQVLYSMEVEVITPDLLQASTDAASAKMQDLIKSSNGLSAVPHQEILSSLPVIDAIQEQVATRAIDLIVVGTHGASGVEKLTLGSVAESVLRASSRPVMLVGPNVHGTHSTLKSLVLATDLAFGSLRAAQYASAIAEEENARLTLLTVVPRETRAPGEPRVVIEQRLQAALRQLLPSDAQLWCDPTLCVEFGDPREEIAAAVKEFAADLLVMGVRPRGPLADHAPWSTFSKIIRSVPCPVLAVPSRL
jgi:nucleotide-binding universal stress UspA family protein